MTTTVPSTNHPDASTPIDDANVIMDIRGLSMRYPVRGRGLFAKVKGYLQAVDDVNLTIRRGEVLGLVGESGCGKSTLGRCIVGMQRPTSGEVRFRSRTGEFVDLAAVKNRELRRNQQDVRVVFQDPFSCLNPRMTVAQIIGDPLTVRKLAKGSELEDRIAETMRSVGLSPSLMDRFPHSFSGGQRQRINIARALIVKPRLVIADEAVSALDVSVRAQIINLLRELQDEHDLTYLFISHDLSVVESVCDRVAVMYLGKIAEVADTDDLYRAPHHPYTEALLAAVPQPDPRLRHRRNRIRIADDIPDAANPPSGCYFHTRCPYALDRCKTDRPQRVEGPEGRIVACHRADELNLAGISMNVDE